MVVEKKRWQKMIETSVEEYEQKEEAKWREQERRELQEYREWWEKEGGLS